MSEPSKPIDLNELRQRILGGQPYTREELRDALAALRINRTEAVTTKQAKRKAAAPMDDASLDDSLRQLGLEV